MCPINCGCKYEDVNSSSSFCSEFNPFQANTGSGGARWSGQIVLSVDGICSY